MNQSTIQQELIISLQGQQAHMPLIKIIDNFPADKINTYIDEVPYTIWQLVDHIRRTQRDIIDYIQNEDYKERKWPDEYWPDKEKEASAADWNSSIEQLKEDLKILEEIILDPHVDLTAPMKINPKHTVFREIVILANHNSYHAGQLLILKRVLNLY